MASASWRRWASGRRRTAPATSLGCMSRRRAASVAISLPVNRLGTSSQSTMRNDGRRTSGRRRPRRTFSTIHLVVRPSV